MFDCVSKKDYFHLKGMAVLKYSGCTLFRERLVAACLSGKLLKVDKIRADDDTQPGLHDFEANFLRLLEKLSDGCDIEINETGTMLKFRPGLLTGGRIVHDCGTSRSIGWFVEAIIPMCVFCKDSVRLSLTGITNDALDTSVDVLRAVTFPLMRNFGIEGASIVVKKRGCFPKGGGYVEITLPVVRELKPIHVTDCGLIARVRGVAFCAKVSPTIVARVIDSARGVLNKLLPDVHITSDHVRGADSGLSAGYSLSLVAESTTGALLSVESTAGGPKAVTGETPEDVGKAGALKLLEEIERGGVIDTTHQPLAIMLMVIGPEDVSKVRFGSALTVQAIKTLKLIRDAFGVVFKIKRQHALPDDTSSSTILVSCLGMGYKNMSRKIV